MTLLWLSRQTRRLYKPPVCVISVVVYHITTSHAWKHLWWEPDSLSTHYSSVNAVWTEWGVNKSMISDEDTPICLTLGVLWRCINAPCKLFIYLIKGNESDWTKEQVGVTFPKKKKNSAVICPYVTCSCSHLPHRLPLISSHIPPDGTGRAWVWAPSVCATSSPVIWKGTIFFMLSCSLVKRSFKINSNVTGRKISGDKKPRDFD